MDLYFINVIYFILQQNIIHFYLFILLLSALNVLCVCVCWKIVFLPFTLLF